MIDIHTHILPELDDGSSSVDESISMLDMLSNQGVGTVVATPHFYIDAMQPEQFIKLRNEAADKLKNALSESRQRPKIAIGAEFQFYPEICSLDCIEDFCISGTKYILLEMPFAPWTQHIFQSLERLYNERNIIPILAHIERYLGYQNKFKFIDEIKRTHSLIQINSSFILDKATRHKALKLFKKNAVSFVASDSHNITTRPPIVEPAIDIVRQRLGDISVEALNFWEEKLTENIKTF